MNTCTICQVPIVTHQYVRVQAAAPVVEAGRLLGFAADGLSYLICLNKNHTRHDIMAALPEALYWDVRHSPRGKKLEKLWCNEPSNVAFLVQTWRKQFIQLPPGGGPPAMPVDITKTVPRLQIKIDNAPVRLVIKPPTGRPPDRGAP